MQNARGNIVARQHRHDLVVRQGMRGGEFAQRFLQRAVSLQPFAVLHVAADDIESTVAGFDPQPGDQPPVELQYADVLGAALRAARTLRQEIG